MTPNSNTAAANYLYFIGVTTNKNAYWDGKIKYLRVWRNKVLTDSEAAILYTNRNDTNLVAPPIKRILSLGNDNNNKLELTTGTNTTLSLTNSQTGTGTTKSVSSSTALSTTEFSHIVGIIEDNSMNLHIDNTLVGSVSVTPFALNTFFTKNYLGCDLSNGNLFEGKIAYFKTWLDYSLLPSEISDLYANKAEP